jgi:hypothetical protein
MGSGGQKRMMMCRKRVVTKKGLVVMTRESAVTFTEKKARRRLELSMGETKASLRRLKSTRNDNLSERGQGTGDRG